jgi:hypothetical protein
VKLYLSSGTDEEENYGFYVNEQKERKKSSAKLQLLKKYSLRNKNK